MEYLRADFLITWILKGSKEEEKKEEKVKKKDD